MPRAKTSANSRLTVENWIEAGYEILAERGISELKIDVVCAQLGATKGSFYWHFEDIANYRNALIESWSQLRDRDRHFFAAMSEQPPRERLANMMATLVHTRHWTLERAMREWARSNPAAAAGVRASDRRVMRAVKQTFIDFGFDSDEAELRARTTFAAGIGLLHISSVRPATWTPAQRGWLLDFVFRP